MRRLLITGLLAALGTLPGSTLRQLSLDDMIRQSTMIVRGTVLPANIVYHGSVIFSHYTIQVTETYKGPGSGQIDFGVPGGNLNGAIQRVAGAPVLSAGQDYVLFLWTSKTGLTQIIGLSQGLFSVISAPGAAPLVVRAAALERTLNSAGQPVSDNDIRMPLSALKAEIANVLSGQSTE
ncbi:MAG: hypothetical protein ABSE86_24445 [Bryobacteraceae bacterium]|jgi:hypothetical protein